MAYRIEYTDIPIRYEGKTHRHGSVIGYTLLCALLWGLLTVKFWPEGREVLSDIFLPGDAAVPRQALSHMAENLRSGEAIGDAVVVFCREIVDGAALSD